MRFIEYRGAVIAALAAIGCTGSHATGVAMFSSSVAQSVHSATSGGIGGTSIGVRLLSGPAGEDCRNHSLISGDPGSEVVGTLELDVDPGTVAGKTFNLSNDGGSQTATLTFYPNGVGASPWVSVGGTVIFSADSTAEEIKGAVSAGVTRNGDPPPAVDEILVQGTFDATPCGP
jgi:hypothetical protein